MRTTVLASTAALALAASLGAIATGLPGSSRPGGGLPAAAAGELTRFEGCDALLDWYVAEALPRVGPFGLETPIPDGALADGAGVLARPGLRLPRAAAAGGEADSAAATPGDAVGSSATGTTVQEAGVDEPDRAKTDGRHVVHVESEDLVVTDVTGSVPRETGRMRLPRNLQHAELLLDGDTVLVVGTPVSAYPMPVDRFPIESDHGDDDAVVSGQNPDAPVTSPPMGRIVLPPQPTQTTRLLSVSIADPAAPRIVTDRSFGGSLVSARQYTEDAGTGDVRLVLRTGHPTLDFVTPHRGRTAREAQRENRRLVEDSTIEDWLPALRTDGGRPVPLPRCADVLHPEEGAGLGTLTIVTLPDGGAADISATAITAPAWTVYSSTDRLYLAGPDRKRTQVHAFTLEPGGSAYVASGTVPGRVADRWSMDERDGVLRLAVAHGPQWEPTDNGITTLRERDGRLVVVGSVRGLGPREQIRAARWFDDLAVLVTFRQTDPVYTVDLRDPERPRTLGALKIPGFSEYLHPIGADRLIGIGMDATNDGRTRGGQVSLFDIADLAEPARLATVGLGRRTWPAAGSDPRAFTWIPESEGSGSGTGLTAVSTGWGESASLREVRVGPGGTLVGGRRWDLPSVSAEQVRALPLPDQRVALVGTRVRVVPLPRP